MPTNAEQRRAAAGVQGLPNAPGVTPNASKDQEWRQQAGWGYSGILSDDGVSPSVYSLRSIRQPRAGTSLSRTRITQDLRMAVLFNNGTFWQDSARQAHDGFFFESLTGIVWGQNKWGRFTEITSVGAASNIIFPYTHFVPTTEMTVSILMEKADSNNRACMTWAVDISLLPITHYCHAAIPYSDGVVYFAFGGNTAGVTRLDVPSLDHTIPNHWIFTTGRRGMECWQNGVLVGSNSASPTRLNDPLAPLKFGAANFVNSDLVRYSKFCMWGRQLPLDQIHALSKQPYLPWEELPPFEMGRRNTFGTAAAATMLRPNRLTTLGVT